MRVHVESILDCSPEAAWQALQKPQTLAHVCAPLLHFTVVSPEPLPKAWSVGDTITLKLFAFGLIPLGRHSIRFIRIEHNSREIQTEETSALVRQWRHTLRVRKGENGTAVYSDLVQIDAGLLTLPVWLWASAFYRHRHRRWRKLAKTLSQ